MDQRARAARSKKGRSGERDEVVGTEGDGGLRRTCRCGEARRRSIWVTAIDVYMYTYICRKYICVYSYSE